jgi:hypothetical protein
MARKPLKLHTTIVAIILIVSGGYVSIVTLNLGGSVSFNLGPVKLEVEGIPSSND